ncbi:ribonuclease H-like protein [Atractiella rhizophila]|nr:ribonuclease H-like protein [Atractiella rhizophila]
MRREEDLPGVLNTLDLDGLNSRSQNLFCRSFEQAMGIRLLDEGEAHPWDRYRNLVDYAKTMGLSWKDFVVCIDLETTGLSTLNDNIVEIGLVVLPKHHDRHFSFNIRVFPDRVIPKLASNVHGIYDKDIMWCATFRYIAPQLLHFIEKSSGIFGYNIKEFDWPILVREFQEVEVDIEPYERKVFDPYQLLKLRNTRYEKYPRPQKLATLFKNVTGKELTHNHNAMMDAYAAMVVTIDCIRNDEIFKMKSLSHAAWQFDDTQRAIGKRKRQEVKDEDEKLHSDSE